MSFLSSTITRFVRFNKYCSARFDSIVPQKFKLDGNQYFLDVLTHKHLQPNLSILDVGGGKNPIVNVDLKKRLNLEVTGLDIDNDELSAAPSGSYDSTLAIPIEDLNEVEKYDIIFCQSVLEHVQNTEVGMTNMIKSMKKGGKILTFNPNRTAVFAQLNLILPEATKRTVLFYLFPEKSVDQGFPARYDKCTPSEFSTIFTRNGMKIEEAHYFYMSAYFSFFTPLYIVWRCWSLLRYKYKKHEGSETFAFVASRPEN